MFTYRIASACPALIASVSKSSNGTASVTETSVTKESLCVTEKPPDTKNFSVSPYINQNRNKNTFKDVNLDN
jgi:hypothetical protein